MKSNDQNNIKRITHKALPLLNVALAISIASTHPAFGQFLNEDTIFVTYGGENVYVSVFNDIRTDTSVGQYSLFGTGSETYRMDTTFKIYNSSKCTMIFNGTFFVGSNPVGLVDWGNGVEILPYKSAEVRGDVNYKNANLNHPLTFKINGYLKDC